jgi:hypothetical protein
MLLTANEETHIYWGHRLPSKMIHAAHLYRLIIAGLSLLVSTALHVVTAQLPADIARARAEPAKVKVAGDTLYYTGNLSKASSAVFDAAVVEIQRDQITQIVISSSGGKTVAGRNVGRWVHAMGLVVKVDVMCFSSCADYLFPAGRARVIRANAFVGWHGN